MERKPGVAGGSKWTYEATFLIAMKGGREYYTTAASSSYMVQQGCYTTLSAKYYARTNAIV
jgi:hypothetical protein